VPIEGEWVVSLTLSGPITVRSLLNLKVEKGSRSPFWTTAKIQETARGVMISVVVRARDQEEANDSAVYFVGQTLDTLSLKLDLPIYLSLSGTQFKTIETHTKRVVEELEWSEAFKLGREYGIDRPIFSRALGWYRKGLTGEDPIDRFMAFWSSLEGVGSKFAIIPPGIQSGAINQICNCFDQIWGESTHWRVITNDAECINRFHAIRNGIAHGFMTVEVNSIREVASQLPKLRKLAQAFLSDWEKQKNEPEPKD